MSLLDLVPSQGLKPRVVHSLPGRLRVQLPLLRHVPAKSEAVADWLPRLLRAPDGIASVEFSSVSGSLLYAYDGAVLTEQEVLAWVHAVARTIVRYQEHLAGLKPEDVPQIGDRLEPALRKALRPKAVLDEETLDLADVWEE
ncbi:MAG: hypothetical protein COZ06_28635 [Armatimonadetes bacterium CG_4_10_14_3_um_filter_66_18]|nr:hypothetical protein [Armatimonadota bacterium]OIO92373.1 MAG: hypothetical protein AUJ96_32275 [Armatimonadetes bacterium CG2_30_66_41]PIU93374.1 MAG: hypothetical protein COS65_13010 [Armatimonadetes bacterium CG06_land_8_20_14_3_00_66_21]PIW13472.1 MAG: hypothetical protein COW34_09340 [Armatimonadetes bacterium CG17_big_fil_post_rev_8_21_14_2_50_66_6]PIX40097.1 MAG: hypothetical protein COZ57_26830 [Armatimonadetes bacterium CG_4_8_14_3_um_filter_66_20]PIY40064.1 MAG: hypothetical prote